jgi:uncharacterized protein (DUF1800 family)
MERKDAAHLLRRTGYAVTTAEIDSFAALSVNDAVSRVLDVSSATPLGPKPAPVDTDDPKYRQFVELFHDWYRRMANSPAPFIEKMTMFWHNHFTTSFEKTYSPRMIYAQHSLYHDNALGNFRDFAQKMAIEPAMLDYLDSRWSTKWGPNQNFARELLELFLLGVGNYTEADIESASAAWTGYSIADDDETYLYRAEWHEEAATTFFGETKSWTGPGIIDKVFDTKPDVIAAFIARKLFSFLAYPSPEQAIVDELAAGFRNSGWDINELARAILLHPAFYSDTAKTGLVRMPADYFATVVRGLGVDPAVIKPEWYQEGLGQVLWNPPDVSGWKQNRYWISSATAGGKAEMAKSINYLLEQGGVTNPFVALAELEPAAAVDGAIALFTGELRSTAHRDTMVAWLTDAKSRQGEEWTIARYLTTLTLMLPELQLA